MEADLNASLESVLLDI